MTLGITRESFSLATPEDHPEIARILRSNPMDGKVGLTFERSPDPDRAGLNQWPLLHKTIVGKRQGGGLFGCGTLGVRDCYVNGQPTPVGYLGSLRLDPEARNHPRVLPHAYRFLRHVHDQHSPASLYFTSIMNDNLLARKVFEAGLSGMPVYQPLAGFSTLLLDVSLSNGGHRGFVATNADENDLPEIAAFLNEQGSKYQFAPVWTHELLLNYAQWQGPTPSDFCIIRENGEIVACAALWDQRPFSQVVVRRVPGIQGLLWRMVTFVGQYNGFGFGKPLPMAYVSHLAVRDNDLDLTCRLAATVAFKAKARDIVFLVMSFPENDLRTAAMTQGTKVVQSTLYGVHWPDQPSVREQLDVRPIYPEVSLL